MNELLVGDSIGKRFGERQVLSSAYLRVQPGVVTALLGRNGTGKSTLLKILAGLLPADYGLVFFRGRRYPRPRLHRLAADGLFYLPVDRGLLSPDLSLVQHLDALERRFGAGDRPAVLRLLELEAVRHARTRALSGGEQRRAALALALLRRPLCLLADEPFHGITPKDQEVVGRALRALAAQGCGVVLTGHEIGSVLATADDFVWMHDGSTQQIGTRADAERHWRLRREYLGTA